MIDTTNPFNLKYKGGQMKKGYPITDRFRFPVERHLGAMLCSSGASPGIKTPDSFSNEYYKWNPTPEYYNKEEKI
jgi:hypothetical protein